MEPCQEDQARALLQLITGPIGFSPPVVAFVEKPGGMTTAP